MIRKIIYIALFLCSVSAFAQDFTEIENKLEAFSETRKGLNDEMRIDVSGATLYDLLGLIADEHQINMSIDPELNQIVSNSFYDIPVKEVLLFFIKKHDIDVDFMGNIIIFKKKKVVVEEKKPEPKVIDITYNDQNDFLSVKLKNDSLPSVAQKITDVSKKNVVLAPNVKTEKISAYIVNRPFDQVMEMMARSNGLAVNKDENGFYYLEKDTTPKENKQANNRNNRKAGSRVANSGDFEVATDEQGFLKVKAFEISVSQIIEAAAESLNINYFMYDAPKDAKTTLVATGITFDNLLDHVFKGKEYTYKKDDEFYLIGKQTTEGLRAAELIQLENRTIETVLSTLPASLTKDLEVKEFVELNGLMVSGSKPMIRELKTYIREIDKVVPMVQIEVIIAQYNKSFEVQTGLKAGLDTNNRTTTGVLFPESEISLNATSVNDLIDAFNGFGIFNLGKVTENFYLTLKALENNSVLRLESTPKLAMLSGHDALLSIGETSYYFEQNNRLINSGLGNDVLQSGQWKSTEANLSVNIKPYVSRDEHVTLTINVEKSAFLGRAGENAPPGKATQKFESMIRVKNGEMVLLGGLDELENSNSGTGTPFFSRIPIIKWFFSSRSKRREKSKLHIFVKPTVIY